MITHTLTVADAVSVVNDVLRSTRSDAETATGKTKLDDLALESLNLAQIFMALEQIAGCELDAESAAGLATVEDLASIRPIEP